MAWLLDLDGVVWRGDTPIAGAVQSVERLREVGETVWFVSNNARSTHQAMVEKLHRHGIDPFDELVTSPMAAATLIEPGERILVCGGPGITEAVVGRGAEAIDAVQSVTDVNAVMVGLHVEFDYQRLSHACTALQSGARLIATNDDMTYPGSNGLLPGAGAILAAVVAASGVLPVIAGKPYGPMVALLRRLAGSSGTVVGDRADTDGRLARALGFQFGLVYSGVTSESDLPVEPQPDVSAVDLLTLVNRLVGDQ
ncbi:MAG: HAD-IIA family hydrolase [Actinomycetes bacterium]